ncbi:uncharacterized protein PEZ65_004633 [Lycodopsis pacificus]
MLNIRSANTNIKMTFGMFWKFFFAIDFAVLLVFPSAAAELPALTCNVTQRPDGFSFHLSQPPSSPECTSCWELKNKTVVSRDHNLTQNVCQPYLHYIRDCPEKWEEAHCEFNCSHILDRPPTTVNSTLICVTKNWCLSKLMFGLCVAGILLLLVVVGSAALYLRCQKKRICDHGRASYTAANGKNDMEQREVVEFKDII